MNDFSDLEILIKGTGLPKSRSAAAPVRAVQMPMQSLIYFAEKLENGLTLDFADLS